MAASSKRNCQGGDGDDRLSSLDDSLLHHILGFMETVQAVRTCVLSKRWTHLWRCLSTLDFDEAMYRQITGNPKVDLAFEEFVCQVLIRRDNCRVVKLKFWSYTFFKPYLLESLLDYALKNGVQDIWLRLCYGDDDDDEPEPFPLVWPSRFNSCQLHKLDMGVTTFCTRLPRNLDLRALKSLIIDRLHFSQDHFDCNFFSSCPTLEDLCLSNFFFDGEPKIVAHSIRKLALHFYVRPPPGSKVVIDAPRLTTFKYSGYWPMACSVGAPCLEDVGFYLKPNETLRSNVFSDDLILNSVKMVNELRIAKSMRINVIAMKVVSANPGLLDGHLLKFKNLKRLTVKKDSSKDLESFPPCLNYYFLHDAAELKFIPRKWEYTSDGSDLKWGMNNHS